MNLDKIQIMSTRYCGKKHVSYNTILGMENEFIEYGKGELLYFSGISFYINKIINKTLGLNLQDYKIINQVSPSDYPLLFISMDYRDLKIYKKTLSKLRKNLILYIFDCWQPQWDNYQELFEIINPYSICFAYKKSAEHFSNLGWKSWFVPQSMDATVFKPHNVEKSRLFMQMGRRTEYLHNLVMLYLKKRNIVDNNLNYVYERKKGKIIFTNNKKLAEEMSKTYFFMVAPQNIENSTYTGNISEVTARFYEAMASKTLCIGIKPQDSFDELFPYEGAMVEINADNFDKKINELLKDKNCYLNMVENNYEYVMTHHRWSNRYDKIINLLENSFIR